MTAKDLPKAIGFALACLLIGTTKSVTANPSENPPELCNAIYGIATDMVEEMHGRGVRAKQTSLYVDFASDLEVAPTLEGIAVGIEALYASTPNDWIPLLLRLTCTHGTHLAGGFRTRGPVVAKQCPREPEAQAIACAVQILEDNSSGTR